MLKQLLDGWPLAQQIVHGRDGTGLEARSARTRTLSPKNHGAASTRSICPYCAVGCGQLVYHRDGKLVSIEGDPESPVSRGRLCPKAIDLETAMDMIAERVWETRERTLVEERDGQALMQTTAMAHLGGATLDNEENYLIKKLFAAGLGMVCISNQARI
jgi:formate dehydrogenase major subunit